MCCGEMQSEHSLPGELLGAKQIRLLAEQLNIRPTKQLGQNFVIDPNTIERIIREAHLNPDDVVLEVGPGLGSLTLALLGAVRSVIAVEIDPKLAAALPNTVRERAPDVANRLQVVCADAMQVGGLHPPPTAMVANLPYNVSVPVLLYVLVTMPTVTRALVMVQREVGERLAAKPGSKAYGVPSVKAQWFGSVSLAGGVPRTVFWPEPRVDSVLVYVERAPEPKSRVGRDAVFSLVDAAFGQRRKMLRSAVGEFFGGKDRVEQALLSIGMPATIRGEQLTVHDFVHLADALGELT